MFERLEATTQGRLFLVTQIIDVELLDTDS